MATPTADKLRIFFPSKYLGADGDPLPQYTADAGGDELTIADAALSEANGYWDGAIGWFDGNTLSMRVVEKIDLGIAVDTPDGLFVPVLRDVGNRAPDDLREGLDRLRHDVRNRKIPAKELQGATLTLSNFGTLQGRFATPVVVPPQVAIVGAGRHFPQPGLAQGQWFEDRQLPISLTFDHRALNGGQAARFLGGLLSALSR